MRASFQEGFLCRPIKQMRECYVMSLKEYLLAIAKGLIESFFPIAFTLLGSLHCHVKCAQVVFQLKINRPFGSR